MALTSSLSFYLKLDEAGGANNAIDAHTNSLNFTQVGSPGTGTGKLNSARSFVAASAQYFTRAYNSAFNLGSGSPIDVMISFWIKPNSLTASFNSPVILSKDKDSGGIQIFADSAVLKFQLASTTVTGPTLTSGVWYHVVAYADASVTTAYLVIDGNTGSPYTSPYAGSTDSGGALFLGTSSAAGYEGLLSWDGLIDEVGWWSRKPAAGEIATLYGGGTPPAYPFSGGDTTPPTLASLAVPTTGVTLTATLSESGCTPSSGTGGFTLAGTSATVASWAISGTTLTLTLSGTVYSGLTVTLSYSRAATTNDIADAAGNFLADFSAAAVTNNSTQTAPSGSGGGMSRGRVVNA